MTSSPALLDAFTFADALLEAYGWPEEEIDAFRALHEMEERSYEEWIFSATAHAATSSTPLPIPFL